MSEKQRRKQHAADKIQFFSIGVKLITIITLIVGLSLVSIIALVSWFVKDDLQIAAEENNFEINRRSAMETEYTLAKTRSESVILIQALNNLSAGSAAAREAAELYFSENPHVAALIFIASGKKDDTLINEQFFRSRDIESSLVDIYRRGSRAALERAVLGETVLLNAAPQFSVSTSLLAYFFPWRNGAGVILFSPLNLDDSFGFGVNRSCLINDAGDILIHADPQLVHDGINVADNAFIQSVWKDSERNKQQLIYLDAEVGQSEATYRANKDFIHVIGKNFKRIIYTAIDTVSGFILIETGNYAHIRDTENKTQYYLAYTKINLGGCTVITSIEYDTIFEGIDATIRRNVYLTAMVLFISIVFIWFFSKSISIPLKTLAATARTIEGGDFEKIKLKPKGRDEIGILTAGFQRMCGALGIFGRFTNRDIAVRAMRGQIKPGGLPKHATIFFSDIRGFTEKSENFTKSFGKEASDRIVFWLNEYLTKMVECVEKTNGVVDKFIGDAVMAHWGTAYSSGSPQRDAFNCVQAALMMRKELYKMNKNRKDDDPGNPVINIGCGINTGIVTAGQIGSDLRMEYTVIGDPVNLASRVEALNKPLGTDILITEDTWRMVEPYFITEEMPPVTVKGKERPVRIFAVVSFAGVSKGPQTLDDVRGFLGIEAPDISKVDVNAGEKKYKIAAKK
ncbi:MAG: HAMP domain-containing protein [Treponema sp.]|jgi:adenylate cyclase|nr:HAMP domain-containing protein [Treponema sp.]